jgi:hypothetical protein
VQRSLAQPLRHDEPDAAPAEHDADVVASRVMRAPHTDRAEIASGHSGSLALPALQTKRAGAVAVPHHAAAMAQDAVRGSGQPLDRPTRAFFEPRFGRDLSGVRVHTDAPAAVAASTISARAYTLGSDIAFAGGEFQPTTQEGRQLLAHELAHVIQQENGPAAVRRKIRCDSQASLSPFLTGRGIKGFTESSKVYERPKGGATIFEQEVLIDLLASPRVFHLDGDSDATAGANLADHVKARTGIVSFAGKKQYNFAALSGWSMNPAFYQWDLTKGTWSVKPGVDTKAAWEDVNINPKLYAIGCAAATDITMKGGSGGAKIIDKPSADQSDWVAGDAGYIENTKYTPGGNIGILGENIIYTGGGLFWGHFTGATTYRTLADWIAKVTSWNGGANVDTKRELPATGLLDK